MENTFENALAYVSELKQISPTSLQDDKDLAAAFFSYSAKTNKLTKNMLIEFSKKFRQWKREWDLFDKKEILEKPKNLDEFIDEQLCFYGQRLDMRLREILSSVKKEFDWIETAFIEGNEIVIEESYEIRGDEKNDDDCYDKARENGEMIIEKFPMLEISDYYCHRHKYAIVKLRLRLTLLCLV